MVTYIQAYFNEWNDAEAAGIDLRALGATDVTTDRTLKDEYDWHAPISFVTPVPQSGGQQFSSLLYEGPEKEATEGSGMKQVPEDADAAGIGTPVLSAKVEDSMYDQAMEIVRRHSGTTNAEGVE